MFLKINIINIVIIFSNHYICKPESNFKNKEINKRKYTRISNEEENPKIDLISKKKYYKASLQQNNTNIYESINSNLMETNIDEIASNSSSYSIKQNLLSKLKDNIKKKSSINNFIEDLSGKITNNNSTENISLSDISYMPVVNENNELFIKENDIEILPVDTNIQLEERTEINNEKSKSPKEDFIKLFIKEVNEEFPDKSTDSNSNAIIDSIISSNIINNPPLPIINTTENIEDTSHNTSIDTPGTQNDDFNLSIIVTNPEYSKSNKEINITNNNTSIENITPISCGFITPNIIIPEEQSFDKQIISSDEITNYNKFFKESSNTNKIEEKNYIENSKTSNKDNQSPLKFNHIIKSYLSHNYNKEDNIINNNKEDNYNRYNNYNTLNTESRRNLVLNNHFNMLAPFSLNTAYKPTVNPINIEITINNQLKEIFYDERPCLDIYFLINESLRLRYVYNIKRLEKWCVPEFHVDYYTSQCTCESSGIFIHLTYYFKGIPLYLYPKLSYLNQNIRIWSIRRIYNNYMFNFLVHICINKNILKTNKLVWNFFDTLDDEKNYLNLFVTRLKNLNITILKMDPITKTRIEDSSIPKKPFSVKRDYITLENFFEIRYDKMIKAIEILLLSLYNKEKKNKLLLEQEKELKYFIELMLQQTTLFYKNYKILLTKICNIDNNIFSFINKILEDINIFALPSYLRKNFSIEELELISFCYSLKTRIRSFIKLNKPYIC